MSKTLPFSGFLMLPPFAENQLLLMGFDLETFYTAETFASPD